MFLFTLNTSHNYLQLQKSHEIDHKCYVTLLRSIIYKVITNFPRNYTNSFLEILQLQVLISDKLNKKHSEKSSKNEANYVR